MRLTLGHTPDVDDAYLLYGLLSGNVDCGAIEFEEVVEPISALNKRACSGELDVTALSVGHYPAASRCYAILSSGACMAEERGPVLVCRPEADRTRIAVASTTTTAWLAARCLFGGFEAVTMSFDGILDAVIDGRVPAGIVISEDQERIPASGLDALDLGMVWARTHGLPLPLGIDVVRRALPPAVIQAVARAFRHSVQYALDHSAKAMSFALRHARRVDAEQAAHFARTFVGPYTLDLGVRGRQAITHFLSECSAGGLLPSDFEVTWVEPE